MRRAVAVALTLSLAVACSGDDTAPRVLAASSVAEVFTELGGDEVELVFGASSTLAAQIREGADAAVFASADEVTMRSVTREYEVFARNRVVIAVRPGNPRRIRSLADLAGPDLTVVLCVPAAPCGRYARQALDRAAVDLEPSALEENVRAVVTRVALGEADAGIVYATDVLAAGDGVEAVSVPGAEETTYVVAALAESGEPFVARLLGPEGRRVLRRHGFLLP